MKTKDSWLQDILSTTPGSARRGYELIHTICAQNLMLGNQIIEDLLQQRESYYQILGLYGINLLASPKWEPRVLELIHHSTNPEVINSALRALGFAGTESAMTHLMILSERLTPSKKDNAHYLLKSPEKRKAESVKREY